MMPNLVPLLVLISAMAMATNASAKEVSSQFWAIDIPDEWQCEEGTFEWTCSSSILKKSDEAMINFAVRVAKRSDSIENAQNSYALPIVSEVSPSKRRMVSKVQYSRRLSLRPKRYSQTQEWSDALHFESEREGFYTRYFTTIESGNILTVKFLVRKDKTADYGKIFEKAANSMVAYRQPAPYCGVSTSDSFTDRHGISVIPKKKDEGRSFWSRIGL